MARAGVAVMLGSLVLALPVLARAGGDEGRWDRVELTNGRTLLGSVHQEGAGWRLRLPLGSIFLKAHQVRAIHTRHDPLDELKRLRRKGLQSGTAAERYRFATFCAQLGLRREARRGYLSVLRLEPDHAGARRALGYVRHDGVWMTEEQRQRARGLVKYRGEWLTPAERDRRLAAAARRKAAQIERAATRRAAELLRQARLRAARLERTARARREAEARAAAKRLREAEQARIDQEAALALSLARARARVACAPRRRRTTRRRSRARPRRRAPARRVAPPRGRRLQRGGPARRTFPRPRSSIGTVRRVRYAAPKHVADRDDLPAPLPSHWKPSRVRLATGRR